MVHRKGMTQGPGLLGCGASRPYGAFCQTMTFRQRPHMSANPPIFPCAAVLLGALLLGLPRAAHAQKQQRQQPPRRSVVLKPAAPGDAGARRRSSEMRLSLEERLSPRLREPLARNARLDTAATPGRRAADDRWFAMDKAKHAGGSFLLVLGEQYVFAHKAALDRDPALALSLAGGAAVGVAKELHDRRLGPTRYFSVKDLVADALGLLLGAGVVLL